MHARGHVLAHVLCWGRRVCDQNPKIRGPFRRSPPRLQFVSRERLVTAREALWPIVMVPVSPKLGPAKTPPPRSRTVPRGTPTTAAASRKRPPCQDLQKSSRQTFPEDAPEAGCKRNRCAPPELEVVGTPVTLCHELRGAKTLQVHELQLPLAVLERVCLRLPDASRRGNLVGAFLPSNLGLPSCVEYTDTLQLLHDRVAEHTPSPMPLRLVLRNADGETAACQLPPTAVLPAAPPLAASTSRAPISRAPISLAACASRPPACGSGLLGEAMSLSRRPKSCDPRRAAPVQVH